MTDSSSPPWTAPAWIDRTQCLLESYHRWLGSDLIAPVGPLEDQSERLFHAPVVVVAHGTQDDPILDYANQAAVDLWETDLETLLRLPSRKTAEPVHRDERAAMLRRTREQGFIDDYAGVRITTTGRRFRINQATVWNLIDAEGRHAGQAAAFSEWTWLSEDRSLPDDSSLRSD